MIVPNDGKKKKKKKSVGEEKAVESQRVPFFPPYFLARTPTLIESFVTNTA